MEGKYKFNIAVVNSGYTEDAVMVNFKGTVDELNKVLPAYVLSVVKNEFEFGDTVPEEVTISKVETFNDNGVERVRWESRNSCIQYTDCHIDIVVSLESEINNIADLVDEDMKQAAQKYGEGISNAQMDDFKARFFEECEAED